MSIPQNSEEMLEMLKSYKIDDSKNDIEVQDSLKFNY